MTEDRAKAQNKEFSKNKLGHQFSYKHALQKPPQQKKTKKHINLGFDS